MPDASAADVRALLTPEGATLMARLPPYDEGAALATAELLRREGVPAGLAAAAMTQSRLRARGRHRLGPDADRMWLTEAGLEQATRRVVADRHAGRFARLGVRTVADLCCGVGGDLLALARAGVPRVVGVDRDPVTAAVAAANAAALGLGDRVDVRCEDVTTTSLDGVDAVFVDPARRGAHGRALDPRHWSPPLSFVLDVAARVAATGAKLAPGVPHTALPTDAEAEWVSDGGDVLECALWCGPLSTGVRRRATLLPSGADADRRRHPAGSRRPGGSLPRRARRRGDPGRPGRGARRPRRRPPGRPDDRLRHDRRGAGDAVRHVVRGDRRAAVRGEAAARAAPRARRRPA